MNEPLKTCPFCGGAAILDKTTRHGNGGCDLFTWRAGCGVCGAQVPSAGDEAVRDENGIRLIKDGALEVTAAWNRRAPQIINGDFAGLSVPEFEQTIAGLLGLVPIIIPFLMERNYENMGAEDAAECALTLQIAADAVTELMQQVRGKGGIQDD